MQRARKRKNMTELRCVLCEHLNLHFYHQDQKHEYWQCQNCKLVQVPQLFHLTSKQEKAEYNKHDNQNENFGYHCLSRCLSPVLDRVKSGQVGLNFGCGEGQVLSKMAQGSNVNIQNHDLFYSMATFEWLTERYGWQLDNVTDDVDIFHKVK